MKSTDFVLTRYDADDGMVFDWKDPRFIEFRDETTGELVKEQEHLFAKTLFIGGSDSIENYIEVEENGTN